MATICGRAGGKEALDFLSGQEALRGRQAARQTEPWRPLDQPLGLGSIQGGADIDQLLPGGRAQLPRVHTVADVGIHGALSELGRPEPPKDLARGPELLGCLLAPVGDEKVKDLADRDFLLRGRDGEPG